MVIRRVLKVLFEPAEGMLEVTKSPDLWTVLSLNLVIVVAFALISAIHFSSLAPANYLGVYWTTSLLIPVVGFLFKDTAIAVGLVFLSSFLLGNATFRQSLTVAAYAYIPVNLFSYGLSALLIANHWTTAIQPTSLAVLDVWLPANLHSVVRFLSLLDPFKIWAVVLVGMGFSKATKCSPKKAMVTIIACWMALIAFQYSVVFS